MTGQSETGVYSVVTDAEFPHGLRCSDCMTVIEPGQLYRSTPDSMTGDGTPVERLVCDQHP